MKNGNIDAFLDTGWYSESTLFYNGYVYWFEGYTDFDSRISTFAIDKWQAKCDDGMFYHEYLDNAGTKIDYQTVYSESAGELALLKKHFLQQPIFDGKSFWEVESELIWVEEGAPIKITT